MSPEKKIFCEINHRLFAANTTNANSKATKIRTPIVMHKVAQEKADIVTGSVPCIQKPFSHFTVIPTPVMR